MQPLGVSQISSQAPYENLVFSMGIPWHGIYRIFRPVFQNDSWETNQSVANIGQFKIVLKFQVNSLTVPPNNRNANSRA